ncbi:MAG TPA: response regulator transcription factor [Planctomycetota bacterium]|nr:response regulator transcription factor [Planctomycetota bacterium]
MGAQILVIEDEADMAMGLRDNLEFEGYSVATAQDGENGLRLAEELAPDLILLDVMLPKIDGFETCRRLRQAGVRAPILMLTARGQEIDKVRGLELGADDYITKPFGIKELVARIRAALRRSQGASLGETCQEIHIGDATVRLDTSRVLLDGREIPLGYYEGEVLRILSANRGRAVSRQHLLKEIWGLENEPMNRSVDNHIVTLRRKIEPVPSSPRYILTVHGQGYKLVP